MTREAPSGVMENFLDSSPFMVEIAPLIGPYIISILTSRCVELRGVVIEAIRKLGYCKLYVLLSGGLHKKGTNEVICISYNLNEHDIIIKNACINLRGSHMVGQHTSQ